MLSDYQLQVLLVLRDTEAGMMTRADLTQRAGLRLGAKAREAGLRSLSKHGLVSFHKVINHRTSGPSPKVIELTEKGYDYLEELDGGANRGILKAL